MITNITLTNKINKGIITIAINDGSKPAAIGISNGSNSWTVDMPIGGTVDWTIPAEALGIGTTTFIATFNNGSDIITSNHLDITIKVAIDKVNHFVAVYAETGAFIKLEADSTAIATKPNAGNTTYFDYASDLSNLLFKLTLINDANGTIWTGYVDFNDATISVVATDNHYQVNWTSPSSRNELYLNDVLMFSTAGVYTFNIPSDDPYLTLGINTLKLVPLGESYYLPATTTFVIDANVLFCIEDVADWYTHQLNSMAKPDTNLYTDNIPYTINTICNIGSLELHQRTLNTKTNTPETVVASLNLLAGEISDNPDLDYYNYALGFTFIATEKCAKSLFERINTFAYNWNGKSIPIITNNYTTIATYNLPVMSQPFFENGETRVAITWYISLDFTKVGVYSDEIKWHLTVGETEYPMPVLNAAISTAYGVNAIQENGTYDVKSELSSRTRAFTFTLPYTHSTLTNYLVGTYILGTDNTAFTLPLTLKYADNVFTDRTYTVAITSANYAYESGKIVGLTVNIAEKEVQQMGEYVININWNGGKGNDNSKGNTTPAAFLAGAATTAVAANTLFKKNGFHFIDDNIRERFSKKAYEPRPPFEFFLGRKNWYQDVLEMEDVENGIAQTQFFNTTTEITLYKRTVAYTAAQALRLANLGFSTHYQYASAIASSTAELNAVNEYQNAMTGIGLATSITAGALVGAKVGAVSGLVGTAIGAGFGAAVAITNKAVST